MRNPKSKRAADELVRRGAVNERRTTEDGDVKGWWMDGVYLGPDPRAALRALDGAA